MARPRVNITPAERAARTVIGLVAVVTATGSLKAKTS